MSICWQVANSMSMLHAAITSNCQRRYLRPVSAIGLVVDVL